MKYKYIDTVVALILGLLIISCSQKQKNYEFKPDYLYGKWTCRIMDGEFTGIDTLNFNADLKFKDSQNLSYRSSDSGFEFSTRISFNICGNWKLKTDSLYICYDLDSFTFIANPKSFNVKATAQGADTTNLHEVYHDMFTDLSQHLNRTVKVRYEKIREKDLFLGRVTFIDPDSMIITNNGNSLILHRVMIEK